MTLLALAGLSAPNTSVHAQSSGAFARLRGTVLDADTKSPVSGARVVIAATGRFALTDSVGAFLINDIPSGVIRFIFSAEGYPRAQVLLAFAPGEVMRQDFELDSTPSPADSSAGRRSVQELPTEEVTAPRSRGVRYEDFERRMKTGRGHYVTREQIETAGYTTLQDAARSMRGVTVECAGSRTCSIRMARAPQGCYPTYFVDGRSDDFFGPFVPIRDIEGMEVYTGASDVPGEFAGSTAACGVVVIWTKSGPPRSPARRRP